MIMLSFFNSSLPSGVWLVNFNDDNMNISLEEGNPFNLFTRLVPLLARQNNLHLLHLGKYPIAILLTWLPQSTHQLILASICLYYFVDDIDVGFHLVARHPRSH